MSEIHNKLEQLVDKMPAFPSSVNQILSLTSDINSSPKELIQVIEHDPVLTLKILKLVNSAYFGLSREVTSIKKSAVYIGLNSIKNVAISIAAIGTLQEHKNSVYPFEDFWFHSLSTATIARLLGKSKGVPEPDLSDFFVTSLLHDIGQLALAQFMDELFNKAYQHSRQNQTLLHISEKQFIGEDHAEVGAMLAEKWKLPDNLIQCIRNHHKLDSFDDAPLLDKTIFVANQVSKQIVGEKHRISTIETIPDYIHSWLGMSLDEVAPSFPELNDEISKARVFMQV